MDKLDAGRLKAAVFDWDGTLAETRTPRLWAVNRIMAKYGLPDWESTREKQNKLLSFMDNFPLVFGSRAEEAYREYAELYKANVARMIKTFPGARTACFSPAKRSENRNHDQQRPPTAGV